MFPTPITETIFTSDIAEKIFNDREILVDPYLEEEVSYLSTMRALLLTRKEGAGVRIDITEIDEDGDILMQLIKRMARRSTGTDISVLQIIGLDMSDGEGLHLLEKISEERGNMLPGFREMKTISEFVGRYNLNAKFFINEETKTTVIFAHKLSPSEERLTDSGFALTI